MIYWNDFAGDYYIPKGCKDNKDNDKCTKLCKEVCLSEVKEPWGACGSNVHYENGNINPDDCFCFDLQVLGTSK